MAGFAPKVTQFDAHQYDAKMNELLYIRGSILGYKRSKSNQYPNTSLIQIEGVNSEEEVARYHGKRMAYIYKAKVKKNGSHYR